MQLFSGHPVIDNLIAYQKGKQGPDYHSKKNFPNWSLETKKLVHFDPSNSLNYDNFPSFFFQEIVINPHTTS